jgi:DNA-binding response OmpR family regulator/Flp pilus assembly protein TadD
VASSAAADAAPRVPADPTPQHSRVMRAELPTTPPPLRRTLRVPPSSPTAVPAPSTSTAASTEPVTSTSSAVRAIAAPAPSAPPPRTSTIPAPGRTAAKGSPAPEPLRPSGVQPAAANTKTPEPAPQPAASARHARRAGKSVEPSLLLVGSGENTQPGLEAALQRHRVHVETATSDAVVDAVVAAAPDLILLVGDAARDCGSETLARLTSSPLSSVVPVAILDDNTALDARLRAFRHGAAAVIPRSASVDAIADQIARLAREIPERGSESLGVVGEATLHEFVEALSKELRSGILTVSAGEGHEQDAVRLVLGSGRPLAHFIDDFVTRVRRHVVLAEPLRYEFDERASGTVQLLGADSADAERSTSDIHGLRLALADDDTARADNVAQELRQHGANVVVTDLDPAEVRFARLRQVDPAILLIGESHLQREGYELVRRMRRDTRLRWASLLVVRWDEVWTEQAPVPAVIRLKGTLAALAEPERALRARAEAGQPFDTRLEVIGGARCLRALAGVSHAVRVTFHNPRVRVDVDVSDGLVVGAMGHTLDEEARVLEGPSALSAVLVLSSGRVHVERVQQPATTNIMATVDVALDMADAEAPPISPSLPVPHGAASNAPSALREQPALGRSALAPASDRQKISLGTALLLVAIATLASALVVLVLYVVKTRRAEQAAAKRAVVAQPAPAKLAAAAPRPRSEVLPPAAAAKPDPEPPAEPEPSALHPAPAASASQTGASPALPEAAAQALTSPPNPGSEPSGEDDDDPEATAETAPADTSKLTAIRERLGKAPSCASLIAGQKVPAGPAAAVSREQLVRARKELVRGDLDAAQRAFCFSTQFDKKNLEAMTGLARVLLLRRDARAAATWARRADKLKPRDPQVRALLGDTLARLGDVKSARTAWLAAVAAPPNNARSVRAAAQHNLQIAERALEQHDSARAERFFRRAAILDPKSAAAAAGLGRALGLIGDKRSAVAWANRARQLAPEDSVIHVTAGDVYAHAGNKQRAEQLWREALRLDANNMSAQSRIRRLEASD